MQEDVTDGACADLGKAPFHRLHGGLAIAGIGECANRRDTACYRGGGAGGEIVDERALHVGMWVDATWDHQAPRCVDDVHLGAVNEVRSNLDDGVSHDPQIGVQAAVGVDDPPSAHKRFGRALARRNAKRPTRNSILSAR